MASSLRQNLLAGASRAALTLLLAAPLGVAVTTAAPQVAGAADLTVAAPLYATLVPEDNGVLAGDTVFVQADIAVDGANAVYSTLGYVTIDNSAIITQTTGYFAGIRLQGSGAVLNAAGATISGVQYGVRLDGTGVVENSGTIAGGFGIQFNSTALLTNQVSGLVSGVTALQSSAFGTITIRNYGEISGSVNGAFVDHLNLTNGGKVTGGQVGLAGGSQTVVNLDNGLIQGGNFGITTQTLTLTNSGDILSNNVAVKLNDGTITNSAGGVIDGTSRGIFSATPTAVTVVNDGTIHGDTAGIDVAGTLSLTNSGSLNSTAGKAVDLGQGTVTNYASGVIDGGLRGIFSDSGQALTISNEGSIGGLYGAIEVAGNLDLANSGSILGQQGKGVALAGGYVLNELAGVISGDAAGIYATGAESFTVNNRGSVAGGTGIFGAVLTVTNSGSIGDAATGYGIATYDGTVTNAAGGVIEGSVKALYARTSLALTNYGSINSTAGKAVDLDQGTVTNYAGGVIDGATHGIFSNSGQAVTVVNEGDISGGTRGIETSGALTLTNSGSIFGATRDGVLIVDGGTIDNLSEGTIAGFLQGINASLGGIVNNEGLIVGRAAISANRNIFAVTQVTITNSGSIGDNYTDTGVSANDYATITNLSEGVIQGTTFGVNQLGVLTLTNSGSIYSSYGTAVDLSEGSVTNLAGGVIDGDYYGIAAASSGLSVTVENQGAIDGDIAGIYVTGPLTLTNGGDILSAVGKAVELGEGTVTNYAGGVIDGATHGILSNSGQAVTVVNEGDISGGTRGIETSGALTLTNSGAITSANGRAVSLQGGLVVNLAEGTIYGDINGVRGVNLTTVQNYGLIAGEVAVSASSLSVENHGTIGNSYTQFAVFASTETTVTNLEGATIQAYAVGVGSGAAGTITLKNSGSVLSSEGNAVSFNQGSVTNYASGVIEGYYTGIVSQSGNAITVLNEGAISAGSSGVFVKGPLTLTNSGSILSTYDSAVYLGDGSVTNLADAVIEGDYGIYSGSGLAVTVVNDGSIQGGGEDAIYVVGALTLTNSGSILSAVGTGIVSYGGSVENRGVIQGGVYAARFGDGDTSLLLDSGSALHGAAVEGGGYEAGLVAGGAGADSLTLRGTGAEDAEFRDFEVLTVEAGADWRLSGAGVFAEAATVGGRLALDGTITTGALASARVLGGGALGGGGKIVSDLGLTFESGSVLAQTVGDGAAELLTVEGGVVTVESGANVALTVAGVIGRGESFTILTSAGGFEGAFEAVEDDSERVEFFVTTEGNTVVVTAEKDALVTFAVTPNQLALGAALDQAEAAGGNGLEEVIATIDASADVSATLDQLSGDFHASTASTGLVSARSFLEGVAGRVGAGSNGGQVAGLGQVASLTQVAAGPLPGGPGAGFAAWAALDGTFGTLEDENAGDTDYDSFGGTVGGDFAVMPNLFLGAAVGFAVGSSETADRGATADSTVVRLAGYGRWFSGPISVTGALGASFGSLESERATPLGLATGETDATAFGFAAEGRYALALGGFTVSPLAGVSFTSLTQDAFEESGAGAANLAVGEATADSFRASLGAVASKTFATGGAKLTPEARLVYRHEFADGFGEVSNAFLADATATSFTVIGAEPAADVVEVGAGVTAALANGMSLFGDLGFALGDGQTETNVAAGLRMKF